MKQIKILSASEMKAADQATFKQIGIPQAAVIESAGRSCGIFLLDNFLHSDEKILVFCGSGNNGSDGFVLARCLSNLELSLVVFTLKPLSLLKNENKIFATACEKSNIEIVDISNLSFTEIISKIEAYSPTTIIDSIFGTGFKEEPRDCPKEAILAINSYRKKNKSLVVAIDLPSGINADSSEISGVVVESDVTLAIQALKPAHVSFPAAEVCGEVFCLDVGISTKTAEYAGIKRELLNPDVIKQRIQSNSAFHPNSHKGKRGHLAILGGRSGKFGASRLAGEAALRMGAGLVSLFVQEHDFQHLSLELKELMAVSLPEDERIMEEILRNEFRKKKCLLIGPGLGTDKVAKMLFEKALSVAAELDLPTVIDADGITLLKGLNISLPKNTVLTPHPGEMANLADLPLEALALLRMETAAKIAKKYSAVVVLKGAFSVIATKDESIFVNPFASAVLSTAGSGDVLGGMIGAFISQGFEIEIATQIATYLHGLSGVMWEKNSGYFGALASDFALYAAQCINHFLSETELEDSSAVKRVFNPSFL